ncbi:MAG: hypothetical protein QOH41_1503 [Blastocatellia bacterium]|nr:hypothetical protein [Blastocatellia bacterium]
MSNKRVILLSGYSLFLYLESLNQQPWGSTLRFRLSVVIIRAKKTRSLETSKTLNTIEEHRVSSQSGRARVAVNAEVLAPMFPPGDVPWR